MSTAAHQPDAAPAAGPGGNLVIRSVSKSFGGITALSECSLEVREGSVTALIGPNGSGKTTLFNCVTGFYRQERGTVQFGETLLAGLRPSGVVHLGIARTFQITRIFKKMTVLENMIVPIRQLGLRTLFTAAIKGYERERDAGGGTRQSRRPRCLPRRLRCWFSASASSRGTDQAATSFGVSTWTSTQV